MLQSKEKATLTLLQIRIKQENIPFTIPIQQILCMHNQFFLCYSFDLCTKDNIPSQRLRAICNESLTFVCQVIYLFLSCFIIIFCSFCDSSLFRKHLPFRNELHDVSSRAQEDPVIGFCCSRPNQISKASKVAGGPPHPPPGVNEKRKATAAVVSSRCRVFLPRRLGSAGGLVFPTAAVARLSAVVTGPQRWVAAHAGCYDGEAEKCQPAHTELLFTGVARAWVREVALRVGHAVVEHALRAQHAAHLVDALFDRVWRILALSTSVLLMVEHLTAIYAARPLTVLPPSPRFLRL